jgi:PAS domain S-box-containing protein
MIESGPNPFILALRQRAQSKVGVAKPLSTAQLSADETELVLRELTARQIELEEQNAALRQRQADLEASQARCLDLYNLAPVGYVTLNEQGLITEANLRAAALLGVASNDLIKQPLARFIAPDDIYIFYMRRKRLFETQVRQMFEIRFLKPDGVYVWAQLEATANRDADGTLVYCAVISDITARIRSEQERQKAEAALRTSEARYRALAEENARRLAQSRQEVETEALRLHEVNHRVKNYLAAILVLLQLELRYRGAGHQTPYRSLVEDLTSRIQSLAQVHHLLSANRSAPLSLEQLAQNVMQIAPITLSRQQPVQMEIAPTSLLLSPKQASAVGLILNELATNSLKHAFRQNEPICLGLQTHLCGDEVDLEYRDNGPGYPEKALHGKHKSVGLFLIKALAEHDLEGKITFSNDQGAVARLHFAVAPGMPWVGSPQTSLDPSPATVVSKPI